jgi:cell division protease FtsH
MVGMGDELFSWLALGSRTDALKALRPKINGLLKDQMLQVKKLVKEQADFVHAIAEELLKRGDLIGEEIEQIYVRLNGHSRPEPPEAKPLEFIDLVAQADMAQLPEEAADDTKDFE